MAPILITVSLGLLDFGRLFYYDVEFESALREGARYAAQKQLSVDSGVMTAGQLQANTATIIQGEASLPVSNVTVTKIVGATSRQGIEQVTATYNFYFISPWFQNPPFNINNPFVIRTRVATEVGTGL
jgi:Flp pilus assembly protein TadG